MSGLVEAALSLAQAGLPVFPCSSKKTPCIAGGKGFLDATVEEESIKRMFSNRGASLIGLPTGAASGWDVLDIDPRHGGDGWEFENLDRLPETRMHKTPGGGRHYVFKHSPGVRNSTSKVAPGVDVRGEGGYVCVPPIAYEVISDAEPVEWPDWLLDLVMKEEPKSERQPELPSNPKAKADDELRAKRVDGIVKAVLSNVSSAPDGEKHGTLLAQALCLGGYLHLKHFTFEEAVERLLKALPNSVEDMKAAEKTARWGLTKGQEKPLELKDRPEFANKMNGHKPPEPPPPVDTLHEPDVDEEAAEHLSNRPPAHEDEEDVKAVIKEFNGRYMVVNEAGKTVVYSPREDRILHRRYHERIVFDDLKRMYMNRRVRVGTDKEGRPTYKSAAIVWLTHKLRHQYIGGLVFDPSGDPPEPGTLNLWQGFGVYPKPGCWDLMRIHIKDVVCDGDRERFHYLMGWMANMVQFPAKQGEVAVVMRGGEGTGKGTIARAIKRIFGQHGLAISNSKHLTGAFNAHLRDCVFLFSDEAFFAGDKAHVGVLKSIITEPYLTVEGKHQNAVQVPNYLHVMMASNEEWVVPASLDARRFFVLEVGDRHKDNHEYFGQIWAEMDAGGYEAMLYDLLNYDISEFNLRLIPQTAGLQTQKKLSLDTAHSWWMDVLLRGYVWKSKLGLEKEFREWHEEATTELLYSSYLEFVTAAKERHVMNRETFGRFMKDLGGVSIRPYDAIVGEHIADVFVNAFDTVRKAEPVIASRPKGYRLGSLETARDAFLAKTNLSINWDEGED